MALVLNSRQRAVFEAQQEIFNLLCAGFRRSGENPDFRIPVDRVRTELDLPASIFSEALEKFANSMGQHTVIVGEQNGERYITLGESANVSDWICVPRPIGNSRSVTSAGSTRLSNKGHRYAEAATKNR